MTTEVWYWGHYNRQAIYKGYSEDTNIINRVSAWKKVRVGNVYYKNGRIVGKDFMFPEEVLRKIEKLDAKNIPPVPYRTKKSFSEMSYSAVRKHMKENGLIEECEYCGYNKHPEILGVHHIDRDRNNNSKENLIVVCPMCHSLKHGRFISHPGMPAQD